MNHFNKGYSIAGETQASGTYIMTTSKTRGVIDRIFKEPGMDLKLAYVKHFYDPYAHYLNKVLEILEGHHIRGYGDTQKPGVEINLLPDADKVADQFLEQDAPAARHLERVADLVDGFETPYGMELLASVHCAAGHDGDFSDGQTAVSAIAR